MLIETFVDHKRAEASFRSALLSQNKLHSPATDISPLSNTDQEEPRVRGQEATTPDPSVMLSLRGKSCQPHDTHAHSETWKTYLGYFLCGIMGRISKSILDSGRSSCVKRSETRGEEESRGGERRRLGVPVHSTPWFPHTCGHGGSNRPTQTNWLPFQLPGSVRVRAVFFWRLLHPEMMWSFQIKRKEQRMALTLTLTLEEWHHLFCHTVCACKVRVFLWLCVSVCFIVAFTFS